MCIRDRIIVSQAQGTSAEAVTQLLLTVAQIKEGDNPDLILKGLLDVYKRQAEMAVYQPLCRYDIWRVVLQAEKRSD